MNLFILDLDPVLAAQQQCDKHVPKMVVESAQMMSTAHRILDGDLTRRPSVSGKTMVKYWVHPNHNWENILHKAVHTHHPCTRWTMKSSENYFWHYQHFIALCEEYTYRYGKVHKCERDLKDVLCHLPENIPRGDQTPFELAMKSNPECIALEDPVKAYQAFYQTKQHRFKMIWSKRSVPEWFQYADVHAA